MADINVTYKGGTIAGIGANSTYTLGTSGKWVEDDIAIQSHWNWIGANATLVSNFSDFSVALKDTEFNTWTPSTTAKEILATTTFGTISVDMKNYDYVIKWTFDTDLHYLTGATLKVMPIRQKAIAFAQTYRRPRYYSDFTAGNYNYNMASGNTTLAPVFLYYNGSGNPTVQISSAYGFYMTPQSITLSSTTADTVTLTLPRPILYARCSTTYMATARAAEIDKDNSLLKLKCEVFRTDKNNTASSIITEIVNSINS